MERQQSDSEQRLPMTPKASDTNQDAPQRSTRDELLLRLLKTPPQPRPKRERPAKEDRKKG